MAFAVRMVGYARDTGEAAFVIEPPWWPARELRADPQCQMSVTMGYLDYTADLSVEAARVLHEQLMPRATQGVFASADWQALIRPLLDDLDNVFRLRAHEFSHFRLTVFEWESGLT